MDSSLFCDQGIPSRKMPMHVMRSDSPANWRFACATRD